MSHAREFLNAIEKGQFADASRHAERGIIQHVDEKLDDVRREVSETLFNTKKPEPESSDSDDA